MSKFMYNGVWVQDARTVQFDMHYEKDPSGTDVLWQVYSIRVRGFVVGSETTFPGVGGTPLSTAANLNATNSSGAQAIKSALETPRKSCFYSIAGDTIVETGRGAHPVEMDAHLGPWPQKASCVPVSSGTFMVECGFDVAVVECKNECDVTGRSPIVSVRWTQSEMIDDTWHSRLTTRGRLIVRSDMLQMADNFRAECTPGILPDYIRQSAEYTLSPSGTELDFTFVDKEVDYMPPPMTVKAEGRFTVHLSAGAKRVGQVDLKLTGVKGSLRSELLKRATLMAYGKLDSEGLHVAVLEGTFEENIFANEVTISLKGLLSPLTAAGGAASGNSLFGDIARGAFFGRFFGVPGAIVGGVGGGIRHFLRTPEGVVGGAAAAAAAGGPQVMPAADHGWPDQVSPVPGLRPPDRVRLAHLTAAAFRDPCACLAAAIETGLKTDPGSSGGIGTPSLTPPHKPATYKRDTLPSLPIGAIVIVDWIPYIHYLVETTYNFDSGKVQMPSTGVGPNGQKSSFVTRTGQMITMTAIWSASRYGVPPELPSFIAPSSNFVPLKAMISPQQIEPAADNVNMNYTISGVYVYGVEDPTKVRIHCPTPPFLSDQVAVAGQTGAASYTDSVLWRFVGSANPFTPQTAQNNTQPDTSVLAALAGSIAGVGAAINQLAGQQGLNEQNNGGGGIMNPPAVGP